LTYMSDKIYVVNTIALGAAEWIIDHRREELESYFPYFFVKRAEEAVKRDLALAGEFPAFLPEKCTYAEEIGGQGILSALWRMAEELSTGLEIRLRDIPIRQETVEILERLDLNPYYALSNGAYLAVTGNGDELMKASQNAGLTCDEIGELRPGIARTVINGDSVRYLDRPQPEQLNKVKQFRQAIT